MSSIFEILDKDLAGRIGRLKTNHGIIETPTLMPVINPKNQIIPPKEMNKYGAESIITNSYIIYSDPKLKNEILNKGLHSYFEYNNPIMTDSGSYQLSIYGNVNVSNEEIIKFQNDIGSDICVPLDIPTEPDKNYIDTLNELNITNNRISEALRLYENNNYTSLLAGTIQGSTHIKLREQSSLFVSKTKCDINPIGGVVQLLKSYRYKDLVNIISSSKKYLNPVAPVHLFGAGHPTMLALAVSLGCDIFDSAAYALYAKDERYITPHGTYKLKNLKYFPCCCPICSSYTPKEVLNNVNKIKLLSEHNLYSSFMEIKCIKQAIYNGNLFELVEQRCHSHPKLMNGLITLKNFRNWIEYLDPISKSTFMSCSSVSALRPEVIRYRNRIKRFNFGVIKICLIRLNTSKYDSQYEQLFNFKPPFGAYPIELEETYPFTLEITDFPSYTELKTGILNTIKLINSNKNMVFSFLIENYMLKIDKRLLNILSKYCNLIYNS